MYNKIKKLLKLKAILNKRGNNNYNGRHVNRFKDHF